MILAEGVSSCSRNKRGDYFGADKGGVKNPNLMLTLFLHGPYITKKVTLGETEFFCLSLIFFLHVFESLGFGLFALNFKNVYDSQRSLN